MANTTAQGWILIAVFIVLTVAMAKPFGAWLFALYEGRRSALARLSRARSSAASTRSAASIRDEGAGLARPTRSPC